MKDEIQKELDYFNRRYHYNTEANLKPAIIKLLEKPETIIMVEAIKEFLEESLRRITLSTAEKFKKEESTPEVQNANGDYCKGYYARVKENNQTAQNIKRDIFSI